MPDQSFDAFISYSTNDNEWVNRYLVQILQSWGLTVAIDSKVFLPGAKLDDHIENYLGASRHVLFVCTEHFMRSRWCQEEVDLIARDETKTLIPLELDGPEHVPQTLKDMEITWCHLTERQHEDGQWRKLCQAMGGTWSDETDRVLDDLRDLGAFFGGFMNNRTTTYVVARSHPITVEEDHLAGVYLDHMLGADQVGAMAPVYTLLGRIGKVARIQGLLQNTFGAVSADVEADQTANYIAVGGTVRAGELLRDIGGRGWNGMDTIEFGDGRSETITWDWDGDQYLIYKAPTRTDGNLLFVFSPWGLGTQFAAQKVLEDYWEMARHIKDREMLRVYRADGEFREILPA